MKTYFRSCLCVSLLLSGAAYGASSSSDGSDIRGNIGAQSTILQHPHHDLLVHQNHYRNYEYGEEDCFNMKFNFTYQFDQTFNEEENLTRALFGKAAMPASGNAGSSNSNRNSRAIALQGSEVKRETSKAKANALLADQFGLGADTDTTVNFDPQIQNHLFNFQMYASLGELLEGLYAQVDLPLVHSQWELREGASDSNRQSNINATVGTQSFVAGCINTYSGTPDENDNISPHDNIQAALRGDSIGDKEELKRDRIVFNEKDDTKLANLSFSLGYNFWECPDYHMGAYFYVAAPTGTEIGIDQDNRNELFAPVIGSDHWELGGGLKGHFELYNWDDMHTLTVFMQGYAATALDEETTRTFDLKNQGQLSRYMLLKEFDNDQYNDKLVPAANYTTRTVETEIDIKGEGIIEFMYSNGCGLDLSLGYNIWGQDNEELDCKLPDTSMDNRTFGVKGCAPVKAINFNQNDGNVTGLTDGGERYNGTQSNATAFKCPSLDESGRRYSPMDREAGGFINDDNAKAVDPCLESKLPENGKNVNELSRLKNVNGPKTISKDDIDVKSGLANSMVSHQLFGRMNYTFEDVDFIPYVGLGFTVEFSDDDHVATPERWGVFFNGGLSF